MTYDGVDDVFAANEAVRRRLVTRVEGLDEARANAIERMLAPTEGDGRERKPFVPFSLDEYAEQARGKIEAPDFLRPTGLPLAEGLIRLRESRAALEALRPRFESA